MARASHDIHTAFPLPILSLTSMIDPVQHYFLFKTLSAQAAALAITSALISRLGVLLIRHYDQAVQRESEDEELC